MMPALVRNTPSLNGHSFDVVVVGAGINGSACALECSLRGLETLLVDKSDFGSETSAGCFKIVHGGLRYLQHLDFVRLRESVKEQTAMRRMAPHLVTPLPFLVPTYSKLSKSKAFLGCGLLLYELLSLGKNRGFSKDKKLGFFKFLNKDECLKVAPGLNSEGLTGALVYYDAQINHCERLTFSYAETAAREGASICNYLELVKAIEKNDESDSFSHYELHMLDKVDNSSVVVNARSVINATGPWNSQIESLIGIRNKRTQQPSSYSKGVQLVLPELVSNYGVAIESEHRDPGAIVSRGGRSYFMHPWRGKTLLGTTDTIYSGDPDKFSISEEEIEELISSARVRYKDASISRENVSYAFGGLRALASDELEANNSQDSKVATHPKIIQYDTFKNFISVIGVKYTTCSAVAREVVNALFSGSEGPSRSKGAHEVVLVGGEECETSSDFLDSDKISSLMEVYGSKTKRVLEIAEKVYRNGVVDIELCLAEAEIEHAISDEMAVSLDDVLFRRTSLAQTDKPSVQIIEIAITRLKREFSWSDEQEFKEREVLELRFS